MQRLPDEQEPTPKAKAKAIAEKRDEQEPTPKAKAKAKAVAEKPDEQEPTPKAKAKAKAVAEKRDEQEPTPKAKAKAKAKAVAEKPDEQEPTPKAKAKAKAKAVAEKPDKQEPTAVPVETTPGSSAGAIAAAMNRKDTQDIQQVEDVQAEKEAARKRYKARKERFYRSMKSPGLVFGFVAWLSSGVNTPSEVKKKYHCALPALLVVMVLAFQVAGMRCRRISGRSG